MEDLQKATTSESASAMIFFRRDEDKNIGHAALLASLTRQFAERSRLISSVVLQTHISYSTNSSQHVQVRDIEKMLRHEIQKFKQVYIVIDALDECLQQVQMDLVRSLSNLGTSIPHTSILMSTRNIDIIVEDVERAFDKVSQLVVRATNEDLQVYIEKQFEMRARLAEAKRHKGLVKDLRNQLVDKADGM